MRFGYQRRDFLKKVGASTAALAGFTATSKGYPANETVNVACIGTGGRCRSLMRELKDIPGVRIAAVCDVWDGALERAKEYAHSKALSSKDYREVLDRNDIDAVLIGTPDHWHTPMTIEACQAGKDVYVEKPLTHDLSEGEGVIKAQNEYQRIVQVGMQQRSMPHIQKAKEIIQSGGIGRIHKVHLTWNRNSARAGRSANVSPRDVDWKMFLGPARKQPFDAYRMRRWRWFWDFGGGILTDLMVHHLDIVNWILELDNPGSAVTIGNHFMAKDLWETPDTIQTLLDYPDQKVQVYFEGTFVNARNGAMIEIMGSDATMYMDRGRYEIHPERDKKVEYSQWILGAGPPGADFYKNPNAELLHLTNWIECLRNRKKPLAPAEAGVTAVKGAHLGNLAYLGDGSSRWDGKKG